MLKKPFLSEKSMNLIKSNFYTFVVGKNTTKQQVAKLVSSKFAVDVLEVRTINLPAKTKTQRTRKGFFSTKGIKKALVKIKKGQKIPLFETAEAEKQVEVKTTEGEPVATIKEKKSLLVEKRSLLRGTKVRIEASGKSSTLSAQTEGNQESSEAKVKSQKAKKEKGDK